MSLRVRGPSRVIDVLLIAALAVAGTTPAFATETHQFNVPAEDASTAIREFATQAHVQILVAGENVKEKHLHAVSGEFSTQQGLRILLADSGLSPQYVGDRSIALVVASDSSPPPQGNEKEGKKDSSPDFRVAQVDQTPATASTVEQDKEGKEKRTVLEEVVVTGTNIRGITNPTSPFMSMNRDDLLNAGYSTPDQLFRDLPQNFSGGTYGATPDGALGGGAKAGLNLQGASGINLRGLGESSTLVLLNGHRVVASDAGSFVDTSTIPLAALDRVDVLTDGASAIYGADAVAGTVNFKLRTGFNGAEVGATSGTVTSGGLNNELVSGVLGRTWSGGNGMLALQFANQSAMSTSDRSLTSGAPTPNEIYPRRTTYSAVTNFEHEIGADFSVFFDGFVSQSNSRRPTTLATQEDVITQSNITTQSQLTQNYSAGGRYHLFGDWVVELAGTYGDARFTEHEPFSQPPLSGYVPGSILDSNNVKLWTVDLKADGTLLTLPGGQVKGAFGAEYRGDDGSEFYYNAGSVSLNTNVKSAYGELYIPVVGQDNAQPFVRRLVLSAAARYDRYSNFGDTTNPKVGLLWSPVDDLSLRSSWGTSFRAPTFHELYDTSGVPLILALPLTAPSGVGTVPAFILVGSGGHLKAENSRTWSVGFDFTPHEIPGLTVTTTYYNVHFKDRIITPPSDFNALTAPDVYGSLITPLPNDTASAAFLASQESQGAHLIDLIGNGPNGIRYVFNDLTQNAAIVVQDGIDFSTRYRFDLGTSSYDAHLGAAYIKQIRTALATGATPVNEVNTYGDPLKFRVRGDLTWSRQHWTANGGLNWANAYTDTSVNPHGSIASWTTVDLMLRYDVGLGIGGPLANASVQLSVANVFNELPPYAGGGTGSIPNIHYDPGNADPRARYVSLMLRKQW
jgi:iron complex outermembrane receptor protein